MLRKVLLGLLALELALGTAAYAGQGADQVRELRNAAIERQMKGDLDSALMSYDQAIELAKNVFGKDAPYVGDLYFDAAMVALSCNRWQKAEECLNHTLKLNPNAITARVKLAELLTMRGRTQEARRHAQTVLAKHKDAIEARQVLAMSYQEEGNSAKATREFFLLDAASRGRSVPEVVVATMPPPSVPEPVAAPTPEPAPVTQAPEKPAEPEVKPEPAKVVPKPKPVVVHRPRPTPPARKNRRSAPPKPVVAKRKPQVQVASDVDKSITTRLRSKAVLLTKVGKGQSSEGVSSKTERAPVSIPPVYAAAPIIPPVVTKRPKAGLVPPPPPNVPVMGYPMPIIPMQPPPQAHVAKPKPKPVVVEAKETPKEEKHAAAGGGEEDDFLLEWGEANKKKKKGR